MGVLQFIAWIITVIIIGKTIIGVVSIKYDYLKLINENKKLKEDLQQASQKEEF